MGKMAKFTAIDLFCGAGGLSLGLERAGFRVVSAVEVKKEIAKTYKANHPRTKVVIDDIRNVTGATLLNSLQSRKVDMVAGCPPCQGFSSLTRKYHREDPRNTLVLEMARIIEETNPEMVMMENVPGLATAGKKFLDEFVKRLQAKGYVINMGVLQLADYGVPQTRRRFVLLAGKGFEIPLPKPVNRKLTTQDAIGRIKERPVTLAYAMENGGPQKFNWHIIRNLKPLSIKRLKALKAGNSRFMLPKKLRPRCHANSEKGFQNVYGRMSWRQVPPTITSGCTTPCMGRFGHPSQLRTISVREAALIQTFPKNYKFETQYMDTACDLVGNALPPKFAELVAVACLMSYAKY